MDRPPGVTDGIDREWLNHAARTDPARHAYALWDLDHEPIRARFVSYRSGRMTIAYLLVWAGDPTAPMVHWVGPGAEALPLLSALPPRPIVAIVPESVGDQVRKALAPVVSYSVLRLVADASGSASAPLSPAIRPVGVLDAVRLRTWAGSEDNPLTRGYRTYDPALHAVWAAVEGDRIVGAAAAGVRLPDIWILNGIYVDPDARGHGYGTALTAAAMAAAREMGARPTLYVREDNAPARRIYERLGFRLLDRLAWIDAGAGRPP
ncbi:MAG: GNAT family N-acetyltransferase [Thermoplasmata archaeon]